MPFTRDHLSLIGGVTPTGRVLLQVRDHALRRPDVVRFLQHLLRHIAGKLLVVWDGSPTHRAQVVKDFLAQGAAKRLHLEALPAYAPELNPLRTCATRSSASSCATRAATICPTYAPWSAWLLHDSVSIPLASAAMSATAPVLSSSLRREQSYRTSYP